MKSKRPFLATPLAFGFALSLPLTLAQGASATPQSSDKMTGKASVSGVDAVPPHEAPKGLLPTDYTGDFWTRNYLSGDWDGTRMELANKGIQFGFSWSQWLQGVTDGGIDRTTRYGGLLDYTMDLDLLRMDIIRGAMVKFRAESSYGESAARRQTHS